MIITSLIVLMIAYLASWVMYQKYQFIERNLYSTDGHNAYEANKKWHFWKGINQICVYGMVFLGFGFKMMMLFAVLFWAGFDVLVNVIVLNRPPFYVGMTAGTDKFIRKVADIIHLKPETTSLLIKATVLICTVIFL